MIFNQKYTQVEISQEEENITLNDEDIDSKNERNFVLNLKSKDYNKYAMIIKDIRKIYKSQNPKQLPKIANKRISLHVKKGEILGLLGPNGAGKTTLISVLTGMSKATKGNAWITQIDSQEAFNLKSSLEICQRCIGICPQFDVLWPDLTIYEHLLFYARLKGIQAQKEHYYVEKALDQVQLQGDKHSQTRHLPLGMKRRLSIAISLVANPSIVILDEPTTGLDPDTRSGLWKILLQCRLNQLEEGVNGKSQRAIMITTHSMEEADVLCDRIAIINNGVLKCVGTQNRLKLIYGGGYHLFVNSENFRQTHVLNNDNHLSDDEDIAKKQIHTHIQEFIQIIVPQSILLREFNGNFVYQIPNEGFNAEKLFIEMEKQKEKLKISDWGISQCSLEDVFTRVCENQF